MRVLFLSQYFPPEVGATQARAHDMARALVREGHEVTVVTELTNHPVGRLAPEDRGKWLERDELDGIDIVRVWVKASPEKTFRKRIASTRATWEWRCSRASSASPATSTSSTRRRLRSSSDSRGRSSVCCA